MFVSTMLTATALAGQIDGVTPASTPASDKVIFQAGAYDNTNGAFYRIRLAYDSSGKLQFSAKWGNGEQFATGISGDLGAVANSTAFSVDFSCQNDLIYVRLNSGVAVVGGTGKRFPGFHKIWIGSGSGATPPDWTGTINRVTIYAGANGMGDGIWAHGDSYVAGAGGISLKTGWDAGAGRRAMLINGAAGGATIASILASVQGAAQAKLYGQTFVLCDGIPNSFGTYSGYCDSIASMLTTIGHERAVIYAPFVPYGSVAQTITDAVGIRDEMITRWGNKIIDWRDHLSSTGGALDEVHMYNYPTVAGGEVHLNQASMETLGDALETKLGVLGY
jgi:hypothetical protein